METNLKIKSNKELKLLLLVAIIVTLGLYIVHLKVGFGYTREGIISGFIFGIYVAFVTALLIYWNAKKTIRDINFKKVALMSALIVVGAVIFKFVTPEIFKSENSLGFITAMVWTYVIIVRAFTKKVRTENL